MPKEDTSPASLNVKQRQFATEYLKDLNSKQAAIRAGYAEASAEVAGSRLLSHVKVKALIQDLMDARAAREAITTDRVLREIARLAFADMRDYFNADGSLLPIHALSNDAAAALASFEKVEYFEGEGREKSQVGHLKKLRIWDKSKNLELLGRHLRLFADKVEHTGADGGPLVVHHRYGTPPSQDK